MQRWKWSGSWKVRWGYHSCHKYLRPARSLVRWRGVRGAGIWTCRSWVSSRGVSPPGFPHGSHRWIAAVTQVWRGAAVRAGINFSVHNHTRIYLSVMTVETKQPVISEAERVTYAGKTEVPGEPGFVICGCGWIWPQDKRLWVPQDPCVSGLDVVPCTWLSLMPECDVKGGCGIANPISPPALFFLSRDSWALAMFPSEVFPLVSLLAAQKDLNSAT